MQGDAESEPVPDSGTTIKYRAEAPYRVTELHDQKTRRLALISLAALIGIVLVMASTLAIIAEIRGGDEKQWGVAREFTEIVFTPLVALLGVAVAYYYGSK